MNLLSILILGIILFLAFLALSYISHSKNMDDCSGNCSECHQSCQNNKKN